MSNRLFPTIADHLTTDVLTTTEQFEGLKEEWNLLFQSCAKTSVFQGFPYNDVCRKYLETDSQLEVIVVRENGQVVGIGPFVTRKRFGTPQIEPIGGRDQIAYFGILVSDGRVDVIDTIAQTIAVRYPKGMLHIPYFHSDNSDVNVLFSKLSAMGWKEARWVRNISHFVNVKDGFEKYLSQKSGKTRQTIRRKYKKLQESGEVKIRRYSHLDLDGKIVDRMANIQRSSWLYRRGIDNLDSPFHKELILSLAENRNAEAFVMTIGDKDTAFILNYCKGNHHYLMYTAFEESVSHLNPGENLFKCSFEKLFDNGEITYEFLFGDADYKRFWGNRTNIVLRAVCYRGVRSYVLSWYPHRLHGKLSRYEKLKHILNYVRKLRRKHAGSQGVPSNKTERD